MSDPGIILQAGNINDPAKQQQGMISMFNLAQAVKGAQMQQQRVNALRDAFTNPDSVDPTTGLPTQQAIRKVMQVDLELGVKIQDDAMNAQVKRAQAAHYKTEAGKANFDFMSGVAGIGYDAYTAAKKIGKSEEEAISAGQAARNDAVKSNGGIISDDTADGIIGKPFEPMGAKALAGANKEWLAEQRGEMTADRDDKRDKAADRRADQADRRIDLLASRPPPSASKWQVMTDPKSQTQFRYNPDTAESTTLDGKPYTPGGAAKLAGGAVPRSAAAAYIQKYMQDNPGANAEDISKAASRFRLGQSEAGTIGTRSGAADVAAEDVDIFAKQARDASKALKRTDTALANEVLQNWDMKTKNPELRQLMIAADALVNSRARAISPTGSPHVNDQLEGRKMLSAAFAKGDFEAAVQQMEKEAAGVLEATKRTKDKFAQDPKGGGGKISSPTSKGEYDALPSGSHYSKPGDAPGTYRVKP